GILAAAQFAAGPGQPVGEPFVAGRPMGYLAPAGADPEADVPGWVARADQGEPYTDERGRQIVTLLGRYHSAYQIDPSRPPPPLLVASGFTDDLFPVDEAIRFVNRTRRDHPGTPVALLLGDFGHQRASNKPADRARLVQAIHAWFDEHLRGGPRAMRGVLATTQTCPRDAPAEGPFSAPTFAALARVRLRYAFADPQTIDSSAGDPAGAAAIDPVGGGGDACATTPSATQPGTATYRLPAATCAGYTLLGSPTITARLDVTGDADVQQIAGRLWDVAPDGGPQTLVARGFYRPRAGGDQTWQLAANGWRFAAGHVAKLELLGADAPYGRASNDSFRIGVERLELALPVREAIKRRLRLTLACTAKGTLATAAVTGAQVRRVDFLVPARRALRDRAAPFRRIVAGRRSKPTRLRITARAALEGEPSVRATRSGRACVRR
ncbi:MAG: type transport system ATP-binding protein, partial [Thermoleophilales bacterium]|nr:type transport system ATP-binding protein [Thermoleophilales bacterium]